MRSPVDAIPPLSLDLFPAWMKASADFSDRWCVVGAGPSGLTALKNFRDRGLAVDGLERESDVGGVWNYGSGAGGVYASTYMISSKRQTQFLDFPMPDTFPPYPSHRQALEYLRSYASHHGLQESLQFGAEVTSIVADAGQWLVALKGETKPRRYRGVVIANGHHHVPLLPTIRGEFTGATIHSHEYRTPDILRGKRVLVIGAGNSGCDIAVEGAQHAAATFLSVRRGYHFLPKFLLGVPVDSADAWLHSWWIPLWLRRWLTRWLVGIASGSPEKYGLPAPDHQLFETHPIVNSQLLYYLGHGAIGVRPEVQEFRGQKVVFTDGREEAIDLVVYATGYQIRFPFLAEQELDWAEGRPDLFLHAFSRRHDNLFVAGMIQPNGGLWQLADWQGRLMAAFAESQEKHPVNADWFRRVKKDSRPDISGGISYVASPRHWLEVEYFAYRDLLQNLVRGFPAAETAQR